jgi:DNA-binding LytR/AlgR family response regulator
VTETIKIAVCDDEKNIRSYLVSLIKKQGRECNITEYDSPDAYLSDGKEHDILFLDIEMGGSGSGLDGMGLARHQCRQLKPTLPPPYVLQIYPYVKPIRCSVMSRYPFEVPVWTND